MALKAGTRRRLGHVMSRGVRAMSHHADDTVRFEDISRAMYRIQDGVVRTPVSHSDFLTNLCGPKIYVKNEFRQYTGSFKERGARNALLSLTAAQRAAGVIAASAGNHALALSWHAHQLGIPVTCIMPTVAPLAKISKCRLWADVRIHGAHIGESKEYAMTNADFEGRCYINGYDDHAIIAGAGTIGIEIFEQCRDVDAVVIPVGGGGLIAGVGVALKTLNPSIEIIGVEPENCASFAAALKAGQPVAAFKDTTLADGLAVPIVGARAFRVGKDVVDRMVQVSEEQIAIAMLRLLENESYVVEGAGAAGLAALLPGGPLFNDDKLKGKKVMVPLCGGNVDMTVVGRIIERGLVHDGRLARFSVTVSDRPGGIADLTRHIAKSGASIKEIHHERAWIKTSMSTVRVIIFVETTGFDHIALLKGQLEGNGYHVSWDLESY